MGSLAEGLLHRLRAWTAVCVDGVRRACGVPVALASPPIPAHARCVDRATVYACLTSTPYRLCTSAEQAPRCTWPTVWVVGTGELIAPHFDEENSRNCTNVTVWKN